MAPGRWSSPPWRATGARRWTTRWPGRPGSCCACGAAAATPRRASDLHALVYLASNTVAPQHAIDAERLGDRRRERCHSPIARADVIGAGLACQITRKLADHIFVARFFKIGADDGHGIFRRVIAGLAQQFRRPQAQQPVAPGIGAELHFLVVGELGFKGFLAIVERGHVMLLPGGYPTPNR